MALKLQLRICLAPTLSSVLSNRFLNVQFLLLIGLSTLNRQFPLAPPHFCMKLKLWQGLFLLFLFCFSSSFFGL